MFNIPTHSSRKPRLPSLFIPPPISDYTSDDRSDDRSGTGSGTCSGIGSGTGSALLVPGPALGIVSSATSTSSGTRPKARRKPPPIDFLLVSGSHSTTLSQPNARDRDQSTTPLADSLSLLSVSDHSSGPTSDLYSPILAKPLNDLTSDDWRALANGGKILEIHKLGEGSSGSVSKCTLATKNSQNTPAPVFALKLITTDPNPDVHRQILRELQYNMHCDSPHIVKYYGTFLMEKESMIGITMEYMGGKSLDAVYKRVGALDPTNRINERVMGKIAELVLRGLSYLHSQQIIHRDIKPANILLDWLGNVKLCDFGVSGEAVNSLATTFVGTQYYMAPERIMGKPYTATCDVWLLGLSLLEVALNRFPLGSPGESGSLEMGPIELLQIVLECEPQLVDEPEHGIVWSAAFKSFIEYCLRKDSSMRALPRQMLDHPWCLGQQRLRVRMDRFVRTLWEE